MIEQRSFAKYLLLSILTCGIYALYFWYRYAEDMNLMCQGDGEETTNYILAWLFGILTCGIYLWYWFYQVGNRIQKNGKRYGVTIVENGSSVILWLIIGTYLTCGIAAFFAYYILVKNFNQLADGYNCLLYTSISVIPGKEFSICVFWIYPDPLTRKASRQPRTPC